MVNSNLLGIIPALVHYVIFFVFYCVSGVNHIFHVAEPLVEVEFTCADTALLDKNVTHITTLVNLLGYGLSIFVRCVSTG